jgi:hypothetical protein
MNKKSIFEHYREFQTRKSLVVDIIFAMKKISVDLFSAAPYVLLLVQHKDALFHWLGFSLGRVMLKLIKLSNVL